MVSRKLAARQMQVVDFDWFKFDRWAVLAVLSLRSPLGHSAKPGVSFRGWKPNDSWPRTAAETLTVGRFGRPALGDINDAQNGGDQGDDCDRTGNSSVAKEARRTAPPASRAQRTLPRNLEKTESAEARKTFDKDQGECRDGESLQENTKQAFELEFECKTRIPKRFSQASSKTSTQVQLDLAQAEKDT